MSRRQAARELFVGRDAAPPTLSRKVRGLAARCAPQGHPCARYRHRAVRTLRFHQRRLSITHTTTVHFEEATLRHETSHAIMSQLGRPGLQRVA